MVWFSSSGGGVVLPSRAFSSSFMASAYPPHARKEPCNGRRAGARVQAAVMRIATALGVILLSPAGAAAAAGNGGIGAPATGGVQAPSQPTLPTDRSAPAPAPERQGAAPRAPAPRGETTPPVRPSEPAVPAVRAASQPPEPIRREAAQSGAAPRAPSLSPGLLSLALGAIALAALGLAAMTARRVWSA